jgi:hypothetical protein
MDLLKSQKNALYEMLVEWKLSPASFRWEKHVDLSSHPMYSSDTMFSTLCYDSDDNFFFQIQKGESTSDIVCVVSPGYESIIESYHAHKWDDVLASFATWLMSLGRETNQSDLWQSLGQETDLIHDAAESTDVSFFNEEDKDRIADSLNIIKEQLLALSPGESQKIIINTQFTYLEEASQRLTKKDWKTIVIGTLLGLAIDLSLEPAKAKSLFQISGKALSWLYQIANYLP